MSEWEWFDGQQAHGPLSEADVLAAIAQGRPVAMVRPVGAQQWKAPDRHAPFALALHERAKAQEQAAASSQPQGQAEGAALAPPQPGVSTATVAPTATAAPTPARSPRKRWPVFAAIGALVLVAGSVGGVLKYQQIQEERAEAAQREAERVKRERQEKAEADCIELADEAEQFKAKLRSAKDRALQTPRS